MLKKCISICRISIWAAVLISLFPITSHSASINGNLAYYFNLALKNDPQFRGAEYDSLAIRETLRQAYAGLLPEISAALSYSRTFQDVNSSENTVYTTGNSSYDTKTYAVTLIQPIFQYSSFINVSQAKLVLNRSAMEIEKARQDLALRVAEAYMNVLLYQDKLAAVKAEETAVEQHSVLAAERTEGGLAPITDRYDSEARLAAVRAQRVEAEHILEDALQALAEICGEHVADIKPLKEEIPLTQPFPASIDLWLEAAAKQNPDILIQKLKAEVADKEIARQRAGHYPSLDFQADFNNTDTNGSLYGGGSNVTNYDVMVKLKIPIFEGGLISSKTREAYNQHQSALQGVTKQLRAAEREVRFTYNGVMSAMTRVLAMKKSIESQQLVVEAKEEGFRAGLYISLAILDAMQDLYKYKREYSQARTDYIINSLKLKHTVGTLNPEELNLVNAWLQN